MRILFFAISCTFITLSSIAHSADFKLTNLKEPFKIFVDHYRNETFERQWTGWNEFRTNHSDAIPPITCTSCEEKLKQGVKDFFILLPNFENQMWDLFSRSEEITKRQITRFKSIFSDLPSDVAINFVPSMLSFNGQVRTINNTEVLFIGVDFVALRNEDLNVLFSHEFFHVYHGITLSRLGKTMFQTMASSLWFEGMATWMSIELNSGTSDAIALMDETLALAKFCEVIDNVRAAGLEFLKIIDYTDKTEVTESVHADWFKLNGKVQPKRRGYCLGLQAMRILAKDHSVQELVTLGEDEYSQLLKTTLSKF